MRSRVYSRYRFLVRPRGWTSQSPLLEDRMEKVRYYFTFTILIKPQIRKLEINRIYLCLYVLPVIGQLPRQGSPGAELVGWPVFVQWRGSFSSWTLEQITNHWQGLPIVPLNCADHVPKRYTFRILVMVKSRPVPYRVPATIYLPFSGGHMSYLFISYRELILVLYYVQSRDIPVLISTLIGRYVMNTVPI
jgi:hypothetical protein